MLRRVGFLRSMHIVFALRQFGAEHGYHSDSFRDHDAIYLREIFRALNMLQRTIRVADMRWKSLSPVETRLAGRPRQAEEVTMMESIKQYFQDWSDACEYANECVPDLSFVKVGEPYTALASVALGCFLLWAANEWRIARRERAHALRAPASTEELKALAGQAEGKPPAPEKLAA